MRLNSKEERDDDEEEEEEENRSHGPWKFKSSQSYFFKEKKEKEVSFHSHLQGSIDLSAVKRVGRRMRSKQVYGGFTLK